MVLVWRRFLGDLISLADELFFFTLSLIDERLIRWVFTCYSIKSTVQPKKSSSQKHVNADVNEICVNSWRLLIVRKTTQSAIFATRTKKITEIYLSTSTAVWLCAFGRFRYIWLIIFSYLQWIAASTSGQFIYKFLECWCGIVNTCTNTNHLNCAYNFGADHTLHAKYTVD